MSTATLTHPDGHRLYTFTPHTDSVTTVRSGSKRRPGSATVWSGTKRMARFQAVTFYRQLVASGYTLAP